jgi:hypothetical protein
MVAEAAWHTVPDRRRFAELPLWMRPVGEACPHGRSILIVDGTYVRNHYDSDFVQGGNGYAYDWMPKNQLWVAHETPEVEIPFVAFHECIEAEYMKGGMSYNRAHDLAKAAEDRWRKLYFKAL